ncbi:LysR family transcriptional regulator, partial [Mesorhizobium sp. M1A.F.Ca.IN.022.02.1.1]
MDRLDAMFLFVATVEAGSLSAVARHAGVPLATVSRKLSELERHLKTRLLNRSTRRLTLTDAGRSYLAACRRILDEVGEAERAAAGEYLSPTGELVITAPVVFGRLHVLPIVTDFLAAYPDVDIRLTLSDRITHLIEEHIDLA